MVTAVMLRIEDASLETISRSRALLRRALARRAVPEGGAVAAEYALILGLVAVVIVLAVTAFGAAVVSLFQRTHDTFP